MKKSSDWLVKFNLEKTIIYHISYGINQLSLCSVQTIFLSLEDQELSSEYQSAMSWERDSESEEQRRGRLTQYLDFVKLYSEVYKHKEASKAKKEANRIWKERIEKEHSGRLSLSPADWLEQLALMKSNKKDCLCPHGSGHDEIEFSCAGAKSSVEIAGTFNDWQPEPLSLADDGDWYTTIQLSPGMVCSVLSLSAWLIWHLGVHHYKYVVDGEWLHDPTLEFEDDGKGNVNNVVRVDNKISIKIKEIRDELEQMRIFLDEPWNVYLPDHFCKK